MESNTQLKKGIQDIKNISLSETEKSGMLTRVREYANANPVTKIPSPFNSIFVQLTRYKSAYGFALAALVIIIGGNISYAAASSLPGDLLYPVKIHVNEKVEGMLKFTPQASQKWEERKIEKRLEEVDKLVEKGRFDSKKREQVEKEVRKNMRNKDNVYIDFEQRIEEKVGKVKETQKERKSERESTKENIGDKVDRNETLQQEEKIREELKSLKLNKSEREDIKVEKPRRSLLEKPLHQD